MNKISHFVIWHIRTKDKTKCYYETKSGNTEVWTFDISEAKKFTSYQDAETFSSFYNLNARPEPVMKTQPLYPPNRIAKFPPCPWRAFVVIALILAIIVLLLS